jgi:hypothetical protein
MPISSCESYRARTRHSTPLCRAQLDAFLCSDRKREPRRWALRFAVFAAFFAAPAAIAQVAARPEKPAPPAIISSAVAKGNVGEMFSHRVVSSETRATYRARNLPPEFSINLATGVISGVPLSSRAVTILVEASTEAGTHSQEIKLELVREIPKK